MANKTIALEIKIEGNKDLERLQANFDKTKRDLKALTQAEKNNRVSVEQANKERARLNVQLKANRNALTDQQNALLKNNNALKKNSGFVAGVKKGVGQWATSMIGVGAAIAGVTKLVGSAINIIKEFDQDMANLKAITGSTDEQMEGFRDSVLKVSQATGKGASDIAKAFQLVGSAKPELLSSADALGEVTKQAVLLSQAGGMEVPEAAAALTKSMNQFGASAADAGKFTDILATSQQKGTATIAQLSESLKNVGAVANSAGLTFEETNAALQALAKGGLVAGEAGTGLRGVILRLQKAGIGFVDGQFDIEAALSETQKRFNSIQDPVKLATEKTNLFGTENVKTIDTLIAQKDVLGNLNGALNEYGNAAGQAATVTDTLAGDMEKAGSAWDRFILSVEDGDGIFSRAMSSIVQTFSEFMSALTDFNQGDFESGLYSYVDAWTLGATNLSESYDKIQQVQQSFIDRLSEESLETIKSKKVRDSLIHNLIETGASAEEAADKYMELVKAKQELDSKPIETKVDVVVAEDGGESGELTPQEQTAIENKAKAKAEAESKASAKALKEIESREEKDLEDFDDELMRLIDEKTKEREELALIDEEYDARTKERREEDAQNEIEEAQKTANSIAELERLKRDAREQTLQATASILNSVASLAKEGSEEQKALATASALINTYVAIAGTLAAFSKVPVPGYAIAQSIAIGVSGFANVAKINGVKFQDGGILNGASHAQGGIPFTVAGVGGFEAEGGEAIINKRSTAMFAPLLNQINQAGGGARLFAEGGLTPSSMGVTAAQQQLTGGVDMDAFAERLISGINDKEVINVATDTANVANEVQNVTQTATF